MAYIGRGPTNSGEFIILDDISSGFDGSDTSFTLTVGTTEVTPAAANVTIALDGVIQTATSAYSVTGSTINFTEAPESGQEFHGVLAGQSQYISDSSITNQHISGTANISGSKISTDFGSQNIQIIHVTASGDISVDSMSIPVLSTMSSSVATRFDSRETDMTLATASIALNESNMTLATASIAAITASLGQPVNTDSNVQFADITSTGTITAVEVHTTFVSSSIAVASGSNTFGDDTSDSHQFTGSLSVSGSATIEGSTTLTGTLGVNGSPGEANSKFAVDGNIEMLSGSNRLFIPRASDGALTTSIFSRTGNNLTLSGAGSSGGQVEFIPSSANSSAITLTIESSGRMVASSVLSAGQDHLDGDASLYLANAGSDGTMIKFGDTNAGLVYGGSGTGTFKLMQRENTAVFIDSSRRVGIGDTSPGSPLDVKSGEAANTANFNSTNGATNITFESNGSLIGQMEWSGPGPSQIVTRTSASLALGSNNVKTLYVTDDDRVGIGAASPLSKLDVRNTTETIALNSSAGAIFESEPPDANNGTYLFGDGSGDSDRVQILAVNSDDTIAAGNWSGIGFGVKTNSSSNTIVNLAGVAGIKETSTDGSGGDVGALGFGTRATGDYVKERMRITSAGLVGIGTTSPVARLHIHNPGDGSGGVPSGGDEDTLIVSSSIRHFTAQIDNGASNYDSTMLGIRVPQRAGTTSYNFLVENSSDGEEIKHRGDGSIQARNTTLQGFDYAEFFEVALTEHTASGIPEGITVALTGSKVIPASQSSEEPIGIVRPGNTSAIIGNSPWNNWHAKYKTTDYGAPILDENSHRVINPSYVSQSYTPREDRNEWVIVGLLGQIPITNGQPTGSSWRKMHNISPTASMWFVK